jgi:hypothetical protein
LCTISNPTSYVPVRILDYTKTRSGLLVQRFFTQPHMLITNQLSCAAGGTNILTDWERTLVGGSRWKFLKHLSYAGKEPAYFLEVLQTATEANDSLSFDNEVITLPRLLSRNNDTSLKERDTGALSKNSHWNSMRI